VAHVRSEVADDCGEDADDAQGYTEADPAVGNPRRGDAGADDLPGHGEKVEEAFARQEGPALELDCQAHLLAPEGEGAHGGRLTRALLTVATMALLTMARLTMALLTMALLTMAMLTTATRSYGNTFYAAACSRQEEAARRIESTLRSREAATLSMSSLRTWQALRRGHSGGEVWRGVWRDAWVRPAHAVGEDARSLTMAILTMAILTHYGYTYYGARRQRGCAPRRSPCLRARRWPRPRRR
jgi:hypothetical protein